MIKDNNKALALHNAAIDLDRRVVYRENHPEYTEPLALC